MESQRVNDSANGLKVKCFIPLPTEKSQGSQPLIYVLIGLLPEQVVHHHHSHIHTLVFTKTISVTTESSYRPRTTEAGNPR